MILAIKPRPDITRDSGSAYLCTSKWPPLHLPNRKFWGSRFSFCTAFVNAQVTTGLSRLLIIIRIFLGRGIWRKPENRFNYIFSQCHVFVRSKTCPQHIQERVIPTKNSTRKFPISLLAKRNVPRWVALVLTFSLDFNIFITRSLERSCATHHNKFRKEKHLRLYHRA